MIGHFGQGAQNETTHETKEEGVHTSAL